MRELETRSDLEFYEHQYHQIFGEWAECTYLHQYVADSGSHIQSNRYHLAILEVHLLPVGHTITLL